MIETDIYKSYKTELGLYVVSTIYMSTEYHVPIYETIILNTNSVPDYNDPLRKVLKASYGWEDSRKTHEKCVKKAQEVIKNVNSAKK